MEKNQRNPEIDIMKGIAIILMVWGHSIKYGRIFISTFNMPVFFMLSGIFFKDCNCFSDVMACTKKRIKTLYVYYISANLLFLAFHNLFVFSNIYTNNTALLELFPNAQLYDYYSFFDFIKRIVLVLFTVGGTQLGGATWFFRALLFSSILYFLIDWLFSKIRINKKVYFHLIAGLVFLVSAYFLSGYTLLFAGKNVLTWVNQVLIAYIFFPMGQVCYKLIKRNYDNKLFSIIGFIASLIILISPLQHELDISSGKIRNFYLLITSVAGFFLLFSISRIINMFLKNTKRFLCYLGQNTIYVVIFHLLAFKIVNLFIILYNELPFYCLAGYPAILSLCKNKIWYLIFAFLYLFVGVCGSLVIGKLINIIKNIIVSRIKND